jgi:hypothetical protein
VEAMRDGISLGSISVGPKAVASQSLADDLDSTFNVDLPQDWLVGEVTITATVEQVDTAPEVNEKNNSRSSDFVFHEVPPLNLTIVPILYTDTLTEQTFSEAAHDPVSRWLLSAFPVSDVVVSFHAPITFSGDLRRGAEWSRLLGELTSLWAAEVGPESPHVYYGLVPNSAPGGGSWFSGGISGLGWVGQRVSVGLDFGDATGENAGHEIGHNLGRKHAPCGNPGSVDPHFPYPNASIGVYGVDTSEEILLDPDQTHDVMSYCGPEWVSDYTYEGLLADQILKSGVIGTQGKGMLLRAVIDDEKQTIDVLPVTYLDESVLNPPEDTTGTYQVTLFDDKGELIGNFPATLYKADEIGVSARMLIALVPTPVNGGQIGKVQFLKDGAIVAEREIIALEFK